MRRIPDDIFEDFHEPNIVINSNRLTLAQSLVMRVAIEHFLTSITEDGLGDDPIGIKLRENYIARLNEIRGYMYGRIM